jgi:Na+/H+-translocating membrane pyrophosphatase
MYPIVGVDNVGNILGMSVQMFLLFVMISSIWTVILKGFSLWHAARAAQKWWFIVLLIINTFGIVEIIYLLFFRPHTPAQVDSSQEMR